MMKREWVLLAMVMALAACAHGDIVDPHWVLDPPNHTLRGKTPNDDRPESDCDPIKKPDGTLQYQCVAHTFSNYQALLIQIVQLQDELKACQQGRGR